MLLFAVVGINKPLLQIPIVMMAGVSALLAGWFSPSLINVLLFPIIMLPFVFLAIFVYGIDSGEIPPIVFAIPLTIVYGGLASVVFAVGWTARIVVHRLRTKEWPFETQQ